MKFFIVINFLFFVTIQTSFGAKKNVTLPKYLKTCKYQSPDEELSNCIGAAMEDALRTLKNGEPILGIQPLDPLHVNKLDIVEEGNRPVSLSIHHKNLDITGVSRCKVTQNEFSKVDGSLKGHLHCPHLKLVGDYELDGRILIVPVRGSGKSTIDLDESECDFTSHGRLDVRNGVLYVEYFDIEFSIQPKNMTLYFENLFGGDENLGKTINEFINENWKEIFQELKPSYEAVFSTVFKDVTDKVFSRVPVKNILPDHTK